MPKITRKKKSIPTKADTLTPEQQEKLLHASQNVTSTPPGHSEATKQNDATRRRVGERSKKKAHRLTIDFPIELYEQLKEEADATGRTMKGFLVTLARDYFERRG